MKSNPRTQRLQAFLMPAGFRYILKETKRLYTRMSRDKETGCLSLANEQLVTTHQNEKTSISTANLSKHYLLSSNLKGREAQYILVYPTYMLIQCSNGKVTWKQTSFDTLPLKSTRLYNVKVIWENIVLLE